jgi:photosystem II stability/assembly factor-like uncharacterized protein
MQKWANQLSPVMAVIIVILSAGTVIAQSPGNQPESLSIETILDLGVTSGDMTTPKKLALDQNSEMLFIFSEGQFQQGNTVTAFDIDSGEFKDSLRINTGEYEPLDLQVDTTSGLVYALWRDRYANVRPTLTVINSKTMKREDELSEVESFIVADGLLYTANAEALTEVNLSNNTADQAQRVPLSPAVKTGPLAISQAANRLYLARSSDGASWTVDIFDRDTLTLLNSYPAESEILAILPHPEKEELFLVTKQNNFRILYRITAEGELADLPYELGPYSGGAVTTISPDGSTVFYSNGLYPPTGPDDPSPGPALVGIDTQTFLETHSIPLLTTVEDTAIGSDNQAFALHPYDHYLYQIDLRQQIFDVSKTVVRIQDAIVDSEAGLLYLSDTGNRIRQLDTETLDVLAELRLESNWADYGFKKSADSGQLSLDPTRGRLYVSGLPAVALETTPLTEIDSIQPGGQVTVAPTGDDIYVSNCGVSLVEAETLSVREVISGTTQRPDGMSPNPCAISSRLDPQNQWLYTIFSNGVPGSNGGSYLVAYDTTTISTEPTPLFTDTTLSVADIAPDPDHQRAYISNIRNSNRRIRLLETSEKTYSEQLLGTWGTLLYTPESDRLMVGDRELNRVLVLDGDTLAVDGELRLPQNEDYRLLASDPATGRLFLANDSGQLLVAATTSPENADIETVLPETSVLPAAGPILSMETTTQTEEVEPVFGRISVKTGEFATEPRLFTTDNDEVWISAGGALPSFPVQAVAVSPNFSTDQTLFVSLLMPGQSGTLYRSTDGGESWQAAMTGLQDLWVERIFLAPDFADTGLVLVQTTYGGMHLSTDGGDSWEPLVVLNPNDSFPISAGGFGAAVNREMVLISQDMEQMRGLFRASRSDRDQLLWQPVFDIPAAQLGLSPDGNTALAYGSALWRSADGGETWQQGGQGLVGVENLKLTGIHFSPSFKTDKTVYLFFAGDAGSSGILFRSTDGGLNWQAWQPPDSSQLYTAVTLTPDGDFLLGDTQARLSRLTPEEINWQPPALPEAIFPLDDIKIVADGTMFAINRQYGLFKSTNGGKSWQPTTFPARSGGFSLTPFRIVTSPAFGSDETLYISTGQSLFRSNDGGDEWQSLQAGPGSFPAQQVALAPDFSGEQVLLASTPLTIYRSSDGGDEWLPVMAAENKATTSDILTIAPDGQTAYARFGYGSSLLRSDDAGRSWQEQPSGQDEFFSINSASANSYGDLTAVVEYDRKLLQSPPWQNISAPLPEALTSLNAVAYYDDILYIAGQGGVFTSEDNGQSWQPLSLTGLPDQPVVTGLSVSDSLVMIALNDGQLYSLATDQLGWNNISILK